MSFALPSVKPKPEICTTMGISNPNSDYEMGDLMLYGLGSPKTSIDAHPLMESEKNFEKNFQRLNTTILRNNQGLHAPFRLAMELRAAAKIGRLPFLPSSHIMLDSLTGRDIDIGPEDIYNTSEFCESMGQPHAMIEKSIGALYKM